jgi:hypothetical protein
MIHKLKALGLATIAVLAMSAVVGSAAQAQFTASSYPTTVTATSALGNDVFTVDGSSVECAGHFQGTISEATTAVTITPTYTNCKAFGFSTATVDMNECDFVLHSNDELDLECHYYTIDLDPFKITTVEVGPVTITAGNCEVQLDTQTGMDYVGLANFGSHIIADANVTGITANVTKDGFLCPLNGTGHKTASYSQGNALTVKPLSGGTEIAVD